MKKETKKENKVKIALKKRKVNDVRILLVGSDDDWRNGSQIVNLHFLLEDSFLGYGVKTERSQRTLTFLLSSLTTPTVAGLPVPVIVFFHVVPR